MQKVFSERLFPAEPRPIIYCKTSEGTGQQAAASSLPCYVNVDKGVLIRGPCALDV